MRDLGGAGVERRLIRTENFEAALAFWAMAELEWPLDNPLPDPMTIRSTNYLTLAWQPNENLSVGSTTFFQPLVSDPADIRAFQQADLRIKVNDTISSSTTWKLEYDSVPASDDVQKWDSSLKTGIILSW